MARSTERKTKLTQASVEEFIDSHDSEQVRDDCRMLVAIMQKATKALAEMWGASAVATLCAAGAR